MLCCCREKEKETLRSSPGGAPEVHTLTHGGHLGHGGAVRSFRELRRVVVDVLHLDDELGRGLQRLVRVGVGDLGGERVLSLLLAVQPLHGMDVPRHLVDGEDGAGPFARQHVLNPLAAHVQVGVELEDRGERRER